MIGVGISPCLTARGFSYSPMALFLAGEPGVWYDPSDFSALYQDSAGTTPVTAVGQPVGRMLDKSGRGNHALQPTAINRPVIQQDAFGKYYLAFNGTNSWMSTAAIDFTATDKMTVVAGVRKLTEAIGILVELSVVANSNPGSFAIGAPGWAAPTAKYGSLITTSSDASYAETSANFASPVTNVFTEQLDFAGASFADKLKIRVNGVVNNLTYERPIAGAGNFSNYPLYIGARAGSSLFFNGNLYSIVIRGALSDAAQITASETYANSKTGAY